MEIKIQVLNAMRLTKLLIAASRWLSRHADVLNDLNVYPVPDGDTGTNMSMTLQAVENQLVKLNYEPKMAELCEIVSEAILLGARGNSGTDTGTNMSMTLQAVENQLVKLNYEPKMAELCEIVSEAILLGARGNSGTILSQIIQGFLMGIQDKEEATVEDVIRAFEKAKEKAYNAVSNPVEGTILTVIRKVSEAAKVQDKEEATVEDVIRAFEKAKEKAYNAVSNPVEGTILTVIRKVSEAAKVYEGDRDDFIPFLVHLKNVSAEAVEETPELLPKLKEAGVVDAGGKGIFYILEGFEKSITDS